MKVFVTVGSTQYNQLVEAFDLYVPNDKYQVTIQLADGDYLPKNHQYINFTNEIQKCFDEADVVVSHAGAGSVFDLLERKNKLVVVPNFERVDDHQLDLADFIHENNYAQVCYQLAELAHCIDEAFANEYQPYIHTPFTGFEEINALILPNRVCKENNIVGGVSVDLYKDLETLVDYILSDTGEVISGSAIAINPEKIVKALNDEQVKQVLQTATIRYPDGIGVVKTLQRKTGVAISRIPGVELWESLMKKAGQVQSPVYLIGSSEVVISAAVEKLKQDYNTPVCGYQNGYFSASEEESVINNLAKAKPKLIAVAMGSPKQELFIDKCRKVYPDAYYMGVGGSLDVYTEKVRRAPEIYRNLNLEWFYRVLKEPKRIFRHGNLFRYLCLELARKL